MNAYKDSIAQAEAIYEAYKDAPDYAILAPEHCEFAARFLCLWRSAATAFFRIASRYPDKAPALLDIIFGPEPTNAFKLAEFIQSARDILEVMNLADETREKE